MLIIKLPFGRTLLPLTSVTANTIHFNPKKTDYRSFFSGHLFVGNQSVSLN